MDESGQSDEKALRVEGQGCVFGRQVAFGYLPETETQVQFRVSTKSGLCRDRDYAESGKRRSTKWFLNKGLWRPKPFP